MLKDIFAENLKKFRKDKGLSQEKLAEISGLHRTYISGLELGNRNASLATIEKISFALKIPPAEFFIERENEYGK